MIKLVASAMLAFAALAPAAGALPVSPESVIAPQDADSYVSPAQAWVDPAVIGPGGRSVITFTPDFFTPYEVVTADITGALAETSRLFSSNAGPDGTVLVSGADGSMTAVFVAPQNGEGAYVITFSGSRDYVAIVTVIRDTRETSAVTRVHPKLPEHVPVLSDFASLDTPHAGPGTGTTIDPPSAEQALPDAPDREGRVQIPGAPPEAPEWPGLEELPWTILLLAAIALVATTVTATLLIAARRRG